MKYNHWKLHVRFQPWDLVTSVHLIGYDINAGKHAYANPLEYTEFEEGGISEPFLVLRDLQEESDGGVLQAMMDGLWEAGLRPSNHRDFTQELKATKTHLEDMRQLVFKEKLRSLL